LSDSEFHNRQYWESRLGEHFSLAGVGYLRLGRRYNEWLYKARIPVFKRVTDGLQVDWAKARVLDIGSGTGFYVDRWKERGVRDITGLDLTQVVVDRLGVQHPDARFLRADIGLPLEGNELEPGSFDVISAFDIFFHIVDDGQFAQAFRNVSRLLKPGGYFLWSDNFVRQATIRVAHQASRPLAESEANVRAAGLEVVERTPMFVIMNYPTDTRGRWPKWLWTAMVAPAMLAEPLGWLLGAVLYPVEWVLNRIVLESPSVELMVVRKAGNGE